MMVQISPINLNSLQVTLDVSQRARVNMVREIIVENEWLLIIFTYQNIVFFIR